MRFTCPSCAKSYRLPPERLGAAGRAQISCPNCKAVVLVRSVGTDVLECKLATNEAAAPSAAGTAAPAAPAQASSQPVWFVVVGREKQGPVSAQHLAEMIRAGSLTGASLVWQKGMAAWTKLHDVPELQGLVAADAPQPSAVIAQVPQPAAERAAHAAPQPAARQSQTLAPQPASQPAVSQQPQPVARPSQPIATQPAQTAPRPQPAAQPRATAPQPAAAPQPRPVARQSQSVAPAPASPQQAQARPSQPLPKNAVSPRPPVPKSADLDDAGPTMEADLSQMLKSSRPPVPEVKPNGAGRAQVEGKGRDNKSIQAEAHGASFFAAGHDLNDVELQLPDPNKHKPTKEEYNNLLQEFSVMFRLDKRSKRQKVLIASIAGAVVLGVIAFGTLLYVNANKKRALIADSKAILAVFSLPYQTSVTVDIAKEEAPSEPGKPAVAAADKPAPERQEVSDLSEQLRRKIVKARKPKVVAQTSGLHAMELTAEQKAALARATGPKLSAEDIAAQQAALKGPGNKVEAVHKTTSSGTKVSARELDGFCNGRIPSLRACLGPGGGSYKVRFTVDGDGDITNVKAFESGKPDDNLTTCAKPKMKGRFGPQPGGESTDHTCSVD